MTTKRRPWMQWYPADWRGDPRLRMCSLAARGLWADLISYMHEGEPYGHLTINGHAPKFEDLVRLLGCGRREAENAMGELVRHQVLSTTDEGVIYSRRMVRDNAKRETDITNGKAGGNPKLKDKDNGGVNPRDKAHIPEARDQKPDSEETTLRVVAPVAPKRSRSKPPTPIPDDFRPRPQDYQPGDAEELAKFIDHAHEKSRKSADWNAAWRNWKRSPYNTKGQANGQRNQSVSAALDELIAREEGANFTLDLGPGDYSRGGIEGG